VAACRHLALTPCIAFETVIHVVHRVHLLPITRFTFTARGAGEFIFDDFERHTITDSECIEVRGGHVAPGCIVRTTAEVLLVLLPDWHFSRAPDPTTGWAELAIGRAAGA